MLTIATESWPSKLMGAHFVEESLPESLVGCSLPRGPDSVARPVQKSGGCIDLTATRSLIQHGSASQVHVTASLDRVQAPWIPVAKASERSFKDW